VVLALSSTKRDHIPYRQAKLTNFLRDSLGGNCKTVMVANIWPEARHIEETNSTLKFASRMMKVANEATINIMMDPALQIKRYEKEIRDLKQELAMHDTLSNRGRINYASYNQQQQAEINNLTNAFLAG
jgi:kinesin family protein 6/9